MTTVDAKAARALSPRTLQTYRQDWALFTDWCAASGHWDLPAGPNTVLDFLTDCPATRSTQRCRVAAIDHHHTAAGFSKPGETAAVRAALGRPPPTDHPVRSELTDQVTAALAGLPSSGWTQGMFGRRDRCLLVLSQLAGVPYKHLATLTAGAIVVDGTTTITSPAGAWTVAADDNPIMCGSCTVTRWLRIIDLAVTRINTKVIADAIDKAERVTGESPHLCRSTKKLDEATQEVPVFPPIDQWGALPFPLQHMTPHSLSRRVRDILAGDLGAHRHLPVDRDKDTSQPEAPQQVRVVERRVYSRDDSQRAWDRRRADLSDLAGIDTVLAEIDARARDLEQRTAALLAAETPTFTAGHSEQ